MEDLAWLGFLAYQVEGNTSAFLASVPTFSLLCYRKLHFLVMHHQLLFLRSFQITFWQNWLHGVLFPYLCTVLEISPQKSRANCDFENRCIFDSVLISLERHWGIKRLLPLYQRSFSGFLKQLRTAKYSPVSYPKRFFVVNLAERFVLNMKMGKVLFLLFLTEELSVE